MPNGIWIPVHKFDTGEGENIYMIGVTEISDSSGSRTIIRFFSNKECNFPASSKHLLPKSVPLNLPLCNPVTLYLSYFIILRFFGFIID